MGQRNDILKTFIEVEPLDTDQFLKVKETLTRIGIVSRKPGESKPTLWQSCHILHKQGRYYICHFKQLFLLDGRQRVTDFTEEDQQRTKTIAALLHEWNLVRMLTKPEKFNVALTIIPFAKKREWSLRAKYTIGERHG